MDKAELELKLKEAMINLKIQKRVEMYKVAADLGRESSAEKYKTLSAISSLSATLLVIGTFNEKLIPITCFVKILLVILLLILPISLGILFYVLYHGEKVADKLFELIKNEASEEGWESLYKLKMRFEKLVHYAPYGLLIALAFVIVSVVYLILLG